MVSLSKEGIVKRRFLLESHNLFELVTDAGKDANKKFEETCSSTRVPEELIEWSVYTKALELMSNNWVLDAK